MIFTKFEDVGLKRIETVLSRASGIEPRFEPITGRPEATASIVTRPKPSGYCEAIQKIEARRYISDNLLLGIAPKNWIFLCLLENFAT